MPVNFDAKKLVSDFERAFNAKDIESVRKYYDANVEFAGPDGKTQRGLDAFLQLMGTWAEGFSDTKVDVTQVVQSGNDVAILQRCKARHTGDFEVQPGEKVPATNKDVSFDIAEFLRLNDQGKIVRDIVVMDQAVLMKQLGLLPTTAQQQETRRTVQR